MVLYDETSIIIIVLIVALLLCGGIFWGKEEKEETEVEKVRRLTGLEFPEFVVLGHLGFW